MVTHVGLILTLLTTRTNQTGACPCYLQGHLNSFVWTRQQKNGFRAAAEAGAQGSAWTDCYFQCFTSTARTVLGVFGTLKIAY